MENEKKETVFKVPQLLFGPRPGIKKTLKSVDATSDDSPIKVVDAIEDIPDDKTDQSKKNFKKTPQVPLPYEEPSWGGKPGDKYFLEV